MRAIVLLPAATLPAMPMTYGTRACSWPRNVSVTDVQVAGRREPQVQQPRQREVDLFDLARARIGSFEAAQRGEVGFGRA